MRGMIAAVSPEGVIGLHGEVPWRHPGDMRRFKRVTAGSTVIMGRLTWESMSKKPLPNRRNVVVSRSTLGDVEHYPTIAAALAAVEEEEEGREPTKDVWFIGGARIYEEAMRYCDVIDLTYVPDHVDHPDAVRFPPIDEAHWTAGELLVHEDEPELRRRIFTRKG
jgi:dihydrofolate reductase